MKELHDRVYYGVNYYDSLLALPIVSFFDLFGCKKRKIIHRVS
jgi:hypothetical protein